MWIERHMTRKVITVDPQESIIKARVLMTSHNIRHLPVVDASDRVIGIISDRDIRSALPTQVNDWPAGTRGTPPCVAIKVGDIMTRDPATISPDLTLQDVLLCFRAKKVGAFPVVDAEGRIAGILSDRDLMNAFIQVLGLGSPGTFIGVEVDQREERIKALVDTLSEKGFPIASMLVVREWKPDSWAVFLYLLSQNMSLARHALKARGLALIDPLNWLMARAEQPAG
jgi:acetoin utilization protein AcuB